MVIVFVSKQVFFQNDKAQKTVALILLGSFSGFYLFYILGKMQLTQLFHEVADRLANGALRQGGINKWLSVHKRGHTQQQFLREKSTLVQNALLIDQTFQLQSRLKPL
ncbi:transmembrane protein, putative (macronuclear) [Tetrahymena thermophila SB210]|uniref:Transmembrane protein, putative n=1 Tax=Tetrahymena thermophila (strain SB210) TaxID=312017 RepID=W7XCE1_TETTS|nr:transmembrane protein, putative [Tetrahymena thermophila SB210]EWS75107.1 transmembrane protein, putative [Tetrahymena thermophila SB210]|eukprot:XP_012652345.1 transmembrane protein, putative [Tetrahymena thermophila SB210]